MNTRVIRTGSQCEWEDLKVGEVFAIRGCWIIGAKLWFDELIILATDDLRLFGCVGLRYGSGSISGFSMYRLPISAQRLWRGHDPMQFDKNL